MTGLSDEGSNGANHPCKSAKEDASEILADQRWPTEIATLAQETSQEVAKILRDRSRKKPTACSRQSRQMVKPLELRLLSFVRRMVLRTFPFLTWLPEYRAEYLLRDLVAGITVGVMVIPQSMSYASIAGVPYVNGMYTACVPPLVYTLFGTSKQLVVGPVALESLLIATGLAGLLTPEECPGWYEIGASASGKQQYQVCADKYVELVVLLTAVVGVLEILAYMLHLGVFLRFLGQPVAYGFTAGSAVLIMVSQLKDLLGISIPNTETIQETIHNIAFKIHTTNGWPLLFGLLWLAFLFLHKFLTGRYQRLRPLAPLGPIICILAGALLLGVWSDLRGPKKVKIVGSIPRGLPEFSGRVWDFSWSNVHRVLPTAVSAWLVGDMEAIAIGRGLAAKNGYALDSNQEMLAQGVSNLIGAAFSCYPATGSFSRSAVNNNTGARTQLAAFTSAVVMFLTLLFLTPVFYFVPKFALAAIVINSVIPLVDLPEARRMYRMDKRDFAVWLVSALAVLFLGILWGIAIGVALSLLIILFESAVPQISVLWRLPGTTIYRNIKQESSGSFVPGVFICRIGCSLYFANTSHVKDRLLEFMEALEGVDKTQYVVIEMTSVIFVDYTGARALREMVQAFRGRGLQLALAMVGNRLERSLRKSGLTEFIGEQWIFPTVDDAVRYCLQHRRVQMSRGDALGDAQSPSAVQGAAGDHVASNNAVVGDELSCSNNMDHSYTVVFISVAAGTSLELCEVAGVFSQHGANVVRAQVEPQEGGGSAHRYWLERKGAGGGKVDDADLDALASSLAEVLARSRADMASETSSEPAPLSGDQIVLVV